MNSLSPWGWGHPSGHSLSQCPPPPPQVECGEARRRAALYERRLQASEAALGDTEAALALAQAEVADLRRAALRAVDERAALLQQVEGRLPARESEQLQARVEGLEQDLHKCVPGHVVTPNFR